MELQEKIFGSGRLTNLVPGSIGALLFLPVINSGCLGLVWQFGIQGVGGNVLCAQKRQEAMQECLGSYAK